MSRRGLVLFISLGVIWGIPYFLIRVAIRAVSPEFLVFARTLPATLLLLPLALRRGGWSEVLRHWRGVLFYTVIEFAIPWLMLFRAEQRLSSSLSGLLIAAVPTISVIASKLIGSPERFGPTRLAGTALGLVGVASLVGFDLHGGQLGALGEIALTAIGYAIGPIFVARYLSELPSILTVTSSLAIGSLIYAPFAVTNIPRHVDLETVGAIAGLAVLCTAIGFFAFFELIAEIGGARATVVTYLNPAVAVVLGVVVLNESFTLGEAIGFPLVLAGSWLSTNIGRAATTAPT